MIGGAEAPGAVGGIGADVVSEAVSLENIRTERSGEDLVVEAYVNKKRKSVKSELAKENEKIIPDDTGNNENDSSDYVPGEKGTKELPEAGKKGNG